MEPTATILSLNDDCLINIMTFIRDPSTFNSLSRTCRRLRQLASNSRYCLIDILRSKAEHFIKRLVVYLSSGYSMHKKSGKNYNAHHEFCKFKEFLAEAVTFSRTRCLLTHDNIVSAWRTSGPVASELLKWIRNQSSSVSEGHPRATCTTNHRSFTVYLPKRNQEMKVNTTYFHDYIGHYDDELNIEVKCGDVEVVAREFSRMMPEDFQYWSDEQMEELVESMRPVTDILQEELGETIPSIHGNFLFWFLYFFPERMRLSQEDKLIFTDADKNEKPSIQSTQSMLKYFQTNLLRGFQTSSAKWMNEKAFPAETETCKLILESLDALVQRSDAQFLTKVQGYISRIFGVISNYVQLRKMPEKLMFALIKRTTFETDDFSSGATADKFVENTVSFQLPKSKVIKVKGGIGGDGDSYPTWHSLDLDFDLPNNQKTHLYSGDIYDHRSTEQKILDVGKLSPVTKLLQECINQSMEGEEKIPEIRDMFTAIYFIKVLDFGVFDTEKIFQEHKELSALIVEEKPEEEEDDSSDESVSEKDT